MDTTTGSQSVCTYSNRSTKENSEEKTDNQWLDSYIAVDGDYLLDERATTTTATPALSIQRQNRNDCQRSGYAYNPCLLK